MDQLFLLEIIVEKIIFPELPVPQKKQIIVPVTCGNFVNMEIRTDVMGALEIIEPGSKRKDVDIHCGKAFVFPMEPHKLKKALDTCPLELSVSTKLETVPIGTAKISWPDHFKEMVESSEDSFGYVSPADNQNIFPIMHNEMESGRIQLYTRLSFLGRNIDTHIQIMELKPDGMGGGGKQYLFKGNNAATAFQCQKYGVGSDTDVLPVAPIYNSTSHGEDRDMRFVYQRSNDSIMSGTQSMTPSCFNVGLLKAVLDDIPLLSQAFDTASESDRRSIRERIPDQLFMNLEQLRQQIGSFPDFFEMPDSRISIDYKNITVQEIENELRKCKNPDCPGAKKFKEYGIGPLAKDKGLGGIYKQVEAPIPYGLSQINGRIDNYGPLGTYSRPRNPDEPFKPKKSNNDESPLRLCGGAPIGENFPNPSHACQDLMQEFNKLLTEYKDALGPCGQTICPFVGHLVKDQCKNLCSSKGNPMHMETPVEKKVNAEEAEEGGISACGVQPCPYNREIVTPADAHAKQVQSKPACGSPKCPYVREKCGLDEFDDNIFVPPAEKCRSKPPDTLPPIHWDCPDPLPVGDCKNPKCPYVKRNKIVDKYFPPPVSSCGQPGCPYSVEPCTFPGCPFASMTIGPCPPICPYTAPVPSKLDCSSNCPFADPGASKSKRAPDSDFIVKTTSQVDCTSSACPFYHPKFLNLCDDPTCPYNLVMLRRQAQNKKDSPDNTDTCATRTTEKTVSSKSKEEGICSKKTCSGFGGNVPCGKCEKGQGDPIHGREVSKATDVSKSSSKRLDDSARTISSQKQKKLSAELIRSSKTSKSKRHRKHKHKKRKKAGYVYDEGTYYPGNKIGHKECIIPKFNVPKDMGWLWNVHVQCMSLRPRRGWKPGAIGRTIAARIDEHRKRLGLDPISPEPYRKKKRKAGGGFYSSDEEDIQLKPTLLVKKKNGVVYVTMNPLKDPKTLEDNENPYMDCTPMEFKIVKNKPTKKDKAFKLCYCGEDGEEDYDTLSVSSSSSSELDIEFTPPAGVIHPERMKKKKNVCHTDTQYNIEDAKLEIIVKEDGKKKGGSAGGGKKKPGSKAKK